MAHNPDIPEHLHDLLVTETTETGEGASAGNANENAGSASRHPNYAAFMRSGIGSLTNAMEDATLQICPECHKDESKCNCGLDWLDDPVKHPEKYLCFCPECESENKREGECLGKCKCQAQENCWTRALILDQLVVQCEKEGINPMEGAGEMEESSGEEWEEDEEEEEEEYEDMEEEDKYDSDDSFIDDTPVEWCPSTCTCEVCAQANDSQWAEKVHPGRAYLIPKIKKLEDDAQQNNRNLFEINDAKEEEQNSVD